MASPFSWGEYCRRILSCFAVSGPYLEIKLSTVYSWQGITIPLSLLQPWQVISISSSCVGDFWSFAHISRHRFHGKMNTFIIAMSTSLTMQTGTVFVITFGMLLGWPSSDIMSTRLVRKFLIGSRLVLTVSSLT